MQLCKYLNRFLKSHNKQLKYYLNFIIFFTKKIKSFQKWFESRVGSSLPIKNTVFALGKKKKFRFESSIFGVGQKILI